MPESKLPPEWEYRTVEGPFEVQDIIDGWLRNEEADRYYTRTPNHYYISEIAYCYRKQFFDWMLPENNQNKSIESLRAMKLGKVIEELIVSPAFTDQFGEGWVRREGPLSISLSDLPFVQARGRWDFFVYNKNLDALLELKTQPWGAPKKFEPSAHHLLQVMAYVHVVGPTHKGIVYVNKKDLACSPTMWFPYLPKVMETFFERLRYIHHCVENTILPIAEGKEKAHMKWNCSYVCPHASRELCKRCEQHDIDIIKEGGALVGRAKT